MKIRSIIVSFFVILLAVAGCMALVPSHPVDSQSSMTSTIDGVAVPDDTLMAIQMNYPGQAVTAASTGFAGSQPVYRLVVDHDDDLNNGPTLVLTFDMQWKLLSSAQAAPPPVVSPTPTNWFQSGSTPQRRATGTGNTENSVRKPKSSHSRRGSN